MLPLKWLLRPICSRHIPLPPSQLENSLFPFLAPLFLLPSFPLLRVCGSAQCSERSRCVCAPGHPPCLSKSRSALCSPLARPPSLQPLVATVGRPSPSQARLARSLLWRLPCGFLRRRRGADRPSDRPGAAQLHAHYKHPPAFPPAKPDPSDAASPKKALGLSPSNGRASPRPPPLQSRRRRRRLCALSRFEITVEGSPADTAVAYMA